MNPVNFQGANSNVNGVPLQVQEGYATVCMKLTQEDMMAIAQNGNHIFVTLELVKTQQGGALPKFMVSPTHPTIKLNPVPIQGIQQVSSQQSSGGMDQLPNYVKP